MENKKKIRCAYCHEYFDKLTKEHIPPNQYQKLFVENSYREINDYKNNELKLEKKNFQNGSYLVVVCQKCNNKKSQFDIDLTNVLIDIQNKLLEKSKSNTSVRNINKYISSFENNQKLIIKKGLVYFFAALTQDYLNRFPPIEKSESDKEVYEENLLLHNECFENIDADNFEQLKNFNVFIIPDWRGGEVKIGHMQNGELIFEKGSYKITLKQNYGIISIGGLIFYCVKKDSELSLKKNKLELICI